MEIMSELAERLYQDSLNRTPLPQMTIEQLDDFLNNARDQIAEDYRLPKHLLYGYPNYKHSNSRPMVVSKAFTRKIDRLMLKANKRIKSIYFN